MKLRRLQWSGHIGLGIQGMDTKFLWGVLLEDVNLESQGGDGRVT